MKTKIKLAEPVIGITEAASPSKCSRCRRRFGSRELFCKRCGLQFNRKNFMFPMSFPAEVN